MDGSNEDGAFQEDDHRVIYSYALLDMKYVTRSFYTLTLYFFSFSQGGLHLHSSGSR
jgi:hypothetical protein